MTYSRWAGPARLLARTVDAAVSAARAGDGAAFDEATSELRRSDPEAVAVLLGSMTQELLERGHPDGFDSDDVEAVLDACARSAAWFAGFERDLAVLALVGALGVHDPAEAPRADPGRLTAHGLLLIATLLPAPADLAPLVDSALGELHRAQTVEMP